MGPLLNLFLLLAVPFTYLLPSLVAQARRHENVWLIFFLNLLTGWTVLGWWASLMWSFSANCPDGR